MNNKNVEIIIPVKPFFKAFRLSDEHSDEKYSDFKAAGALRFFNGEENFSVPEYTRYVLGQIESGWKDFKGSKLTTDFTLAESLTREYLDEWTSILTWLLNTAVTIDDEMKSHFDFGFKQVLANFILIFNRLKSIFEYAYELSYNGQIILTTKPN